MFKGSFEIGLNPEHLLRDFFQNKSYSKVGILMDENTRALCYPVIKDALAEHAQICVNAGEEQKNLKTCEVIWQRLTELNFDRHSLLIILGGGVLGDMGGFCAATFKRGFDFVLMPTTLLAQVDASIGGKLGIDFNHYKNHLGVFAEPVTTLISPLFLQTLPERELRSGFAEVIKHSLMTNDQTWEKISRKPLSEQSWEELIQHSVEFKSKVIQEDPKEGGLRKILNVGHTIGHALESYFLETGHRIFHGEAIAAGIVMESFISTQKQYLSKRKLDEVSDYISRIFGIINLPVQSAVIQRIYQDKKNKGNRILMALLKDGNSAEWDVEVTEQEIEKALEYYRTLR